MISIGGPEGCEGAGADPPLGGDPPTRGGASGTFAPNPPWPEKPPPLPGPFGATSPGPDPPADFAFAGGK